MVLVTICLCLYQACYLNMWIISFKGILQGVYWGLGTGGGTIVGGYLSHVFGFRSTFRGFAVVTGVILAVFLTTQLISKYSDLPREDGNEEIVDEEGDDDDEMFLSPQGSDKKSHSDIAEETWEALWKTPPGDQLAKPPQPTEPVHAGESSQSGKPSEPANSVEPSNSTQPVESADPADYPGDLENINEQELPERSEDTTKLIDRELVTEN